MSLGGFIRRKIFWHNNPEMYKEYSLIKYINGARTPETEELVRKRLDAVLEYAVNNTEYYAHLKTRDKPLCLQDFPVVDKFTVMENRQAMTSSDPEMLRGVHKMSTSGSTGVPFTIEQNKNKRMHVIAEIKAMNDIVGYESHEKMLRLLVSSSHNIRKCSISKKQQFEENIYRRYTYFYEDSVLKYLTRFLIRRRIVAVHSPGSTLQPLINYILDRNIPSSRFSVKTVITGSEMIPDKFRTDIQKAFGDKCLVSVKYSNEEMGILGIDRGLGTPYILNVANYAFEILEMDSDKPVKPGEFGRIVITDLFNYAVPLIRYDTGDLGTIQENEGEWPVLTTLHGKRRDLLFTPDGHIVTGLLISCIMKLSTNVKMWQFIQDARDHYCLKIVPNGNCIPSEEDIRYKKIVEIFGKDAKIDIEFTDDIPTTNSQKRRYTVNTYKPA